MIPETIDRKKLAGEVCRDLFAGDWKAMRRALKAQMKKRWYDRRMVSRITSDLEIVEGQLR